MSELVRLPDCPECKQARWHEPTCACSHGVMTHDLRTNGSRGRCTRMDASGACGCAGFEEAS